MARKFPGSNKGSSSRTLWYHRANYKLNAYNLTNGVPPKQIKDLSFFERTYYGMIDDNDQSIIAKEDFLVSLGTAGGGVYPVMDFVANAWQDMKSLFDRACQANLLKKGGFFAPLEPVRTYTSPVKDYEKH